MQEVEEPIREWVRRFDPDSRLLRTWELQGGVSAQMTAFEIARPDGRTQKLVLRRHGEADRAGNPQVAADEFRLLQALRAGEGPATADASPDEGRIRDALEAVWPLARMNEPALLHGDFWPGNVLWKEGRIVAVVDWEDARIGDPLADVGNARLEILWAFGAEAMGRFTDAYRSIMARVDFTNLAYWDLCAALRPAGKLPGWGLDEATEEAMRGRHRWFVDQALGRLAGLPSRSSPGR